MPNERHYSNELNLESVGINLPYNMQAEQSVLGAVLLKPETLTDLVEIIRPEMFYTRQNAQIYSEMLRLFTADQTIDFVTLLDAVISDGVFPSADEAKVYLTGLAETVPSISNVKAYAQIVQEKYLVRQLMGVAKDILQDAGDEPDADPRNKPSTFTRNPVWLPFSSLTVEQRSDFPERLYTQKLRVGVGVGTFENVVSRLTVSAENASK